MKEIVLTRKLKEALSSHFSKGGTVDNVTGELARINKAQRQTCFEYWKKRNS